MQGPGPAPTRSTRTGRLLQAPLPAPAPAPAPFAEKSRGSSATLSALGETRVSPPELAAGYGKDNVPLGPFVSAFELPPSSRGSPGAPACLPLPSLLSSCHVFCCQIGPLGPFQFCFGRWGWAGFLLPRALDLPAWGWWTPSALPGAPSSSRGFPRGQGLHPGQLLPTTARLLQSRLIQEDPSPVLFFGTSPPRGRGGGGSRVSRAESCFLSPITHTLNPVCLYHPQRWMRAQAGPPWCHINMYMCI